MARPDDDENDKADRPAPTPKGRTMATIPLLTHHDDRVALSVETDPVLGVAVALVLRNMTDRPASYTLSRPVGDSFTEVIPPGTTSARRALLTPLGFDKTGLELLDAGVKISLSGG